MKIEILQDIAVSANLDRNDSGLVCAYPTTCRLRNGDVICVYRQGTLKHSHDGVLVQQRSSDGGVSWSEPSSLFDGMRMTQPESVHTGVIGQLANGAVLSLLRTFEVKSPQSYIFSEEGRKLRHQLYVVRSVDDGRTWLKPEPRQLEGAPRDHYVGSRPLGMANGNFLVPVEATGEHGQQIALAAILSDRGEPLQPLITCAEDKTGRIGYGDPRVTLLPDGRVVMLLWTYVNATEETLPVHRFVSADNGRTWSGPLNTHVPSQIMSPLSLGSNRLIAASNIRTELAGIWLWCSSDAGETWNLDSPIQMWDAHEEVMKGKPRSGRIGAAQKTSERIWNVLPNFTFGTPDLVRLDDKLFLLTYYATRNGIIHIRACRFKLEGGGL